MVLKKKLIWIIIVILLLVLLGLKFNRQKQCRNFAEGTVQINSESVVAVAIADSNSEWTMGLSGCDKLPADAGMYFIFPEAEPRSFWMKDMKLPIDIIWIERGVVIGISESVPMPREDGKIELHNSPSKVDAVLEINAGRARELGIEQGVELELKNFNK